MEKSMKTIRQVCGYHYIGLVIGYLSKQDIIKWVDTVIEDMEDFPYELIDVSLSNNKSLKETIFMLKKPVVRIQLLNRYIK